MHALTWHQSGGELWAFFSVGPAPGPQKHERRRARRARHSSQIPSRSGRSHWLAGHTSIRNGDDDIASAARQIAQPVALCTTSARSQRDPNHCAIAAYHGSRRPDNGFTDMVVATAAKGDAPDFEMPAGVGNDTGEISLFRTSHITQHDAGDGSITPRTTMTNSPAEPSLSVWRSPPTVRRVSIALYSTSTRRFCSLAPD
jgi:hypothetical protein